MVAVVLSLLFLVFQPPLTSAQVTYYIRPAMEPSCPYMYLHCLMISEYASEHERYSDNSDDVTLVFLPGEHALNTSIVFRSFKTLTLLGNTSFLPNITSRIVCTKPSALLLMNIFSVEIKALAFQSCGQRNESGGHDCNIDDILNMNSLPVVASIDVWYVPNLYILSCSMEHNTLSLSIYESYFVVQDCVFDGNSGVYGGAVHAQDSKGVFKGHTVFANNTVTRDGGAIFTRHSDVVLTGNITFRSNSAIIQGGGIRCVDGNITLGSNGSDTSGNNDIAEHDVIYVFEQNLAGVGGGLSLEMSALHHNVGVLIFAGNRARCGHTLWFCINYVSSRSGSGSGTGSGSSDWWNECSSAGGAVYSSRSILSLKTVITTENSADIGGAFYAIYSELTIETTSSGVGKDRVCCSMHFCNNSYSSVFFAHNSATNGSGGAMYLEATSLRINGSSSFVENNAFESGGGIYAAYQLLYFDGDTLFKHNSVVPNTELDSSDEYGFHSGGAISAIDASIHFKGRLNTFTDNRADYGGGIEAYSGAIHISGSSIFAGNLAEAEGGAMYLGEAVLRIYGNGIFIGNFAQIGGAVNANDNSAMTFSGENLFKDNHATQSGGAMSLEGSILRLKQTTEFSGNSAPYHGGAIFAHHESNLQFAGDHYFKENTVLPRGYGGALRIRDSKLTLHGMQFFVNNSAAYGGGIAIGGYDQTNTLLLTPNTLVHFFNNYALENGGAIVVEDDPFIYCAPLQRYLSLRTTCFLQIEPSFPAYLLWFGILYSLEHKVNISISFDGNHAEQGGHDLYGGALTECDVYIESTRLSGLETFTALSSKYSADDHTAITSDPFQVCTCERVLNITNLTCNTESSVLSITYVVFPGQIIEVRAVAAGQSNGIVPSVIHAEINDSERSSSWIYPLQTTQLSYTSCTSLEYTLFSNQSSIATMQLFAEGPCGEYGKSLVILIQFLSCPDGFALSSFGSCECETRLQKYTNSCNIDRQTITRSSDFWVGYNSYGLMLHPHCPFDYCTLDTVSFTLNSTDLQCAHKRAGVLCGGCNSGLSLNLGNSQCSSCSNTYLLLLLAFAIAGLALVAFMFTCKVTVAAGTTSGLIFYANVLAVNRNLFLPPGESNILTVFIAWFNLDLGIETCLFDGMDTYTRTWLQFAFPLYIWLLVGLISLVSRYSIMVARIIGPTNPIAVLATLFLISYAKLLRTIIATVSFTTLEYPDDRRVTVWVYDGNIGYLEGKHIPLFLAGLIAFLFLFLPYTVLLFFGQWIVARSNLKLLYWVNNPKIKAFLDAYHAPFKNKHRYWTGLLLLIRFVLFTFSAIVDINSPRDPRINLLILGSACIGLSVWVINTGSIYKKRTLTAIESSFLLNLTVLALASYHVTVEGGSQAAVAYTSMSIAFVTFVGVITYHASQRVLSSRMWRQKIHGWKTRCQHPQDPIEMAPSNPPPPPVTKTVVDLRESVMEHLDQ